MPREQLPRCALCNAQPKSKGHYERPEHKVKVALARQRAEGYVPIRTTGVLLRRVVPEMLRQDDLYVLQGDVGTGWYGPRWAVGVAIHTEYPIHVRRVAIERLRNDLELRTAMLMFKDFMDGSMLEWLQGQGLFPAPKGNEEAQAKMAANIRWEGSL